LPELEHDLLKRESTMHYLEIGGIYLQKINFESMRHGIFMSNGCFGAVYCACWDGAYVAVKKLQVHANATKDFIREVRQMAHLNHPRIVKLFGVCERQNHLSMAMEFCPFGTLASALNRISQFKDKENYPIRLAVADQIML